MTDTIFGLATAPGRAAIAVVRCSGPGAARVADEMAGGRPLARHASVRTLRGARGEILDRAVVLWFPAPASYTGEDCIELHLHGGPAVVDGVATALLAAGLRPAAPGEFTRRAFENGKLDLTQAEAIADLVDADSRVQVRQALRQADGDVGRRFSRWRAALVEALALVEAGVDFVEEAAGEDIAERARPRLAALLGQLDAALGDEARGRRVREGYRLAIIGAPNAGKSSLLNRLLGRPAAIVAPTPGTTRDVIEAVLDIDGYHVLVADTAGLRATRAPVEAEGVRRARAWAGEADLRLLVVDRAGSAVAGRQAADLAVEGDLLLLNKADRRDGPAAAAALRLADRRGLALFDVQLAGAADGAAERAWEAALGAVRKRVIGDCAGGEAPAVTRARHARLLREARDSVARAVASLDEPELAAEDLRLAARSLARVTGEIGVEDVLDEVFARFCIGK